MVVIFYSVFWPLLVVSKKKWINALIDSTSFSLTGEYLVEEEEKNAITMTHGHSKDHRPDLKQVMLELFVSQDEGVPFASQSWDGNGSDNVILRRGLKPWWMNSKPVKPHIF